MTTNNTIQYRNQSKSKSKITISAVGVTIKLAQKDVKFEKEILDYATALRSKLLCCNKLSQPVKIKVNYIDGKILRYKSIKIKYNGKAIRYAMEVK